MVSVDLKGVHTVKIKAKGKVHTYYYAWRGGPRLKGKPGSPEFVASFNDAIADLKTPDTDRFGSVVALYRGSNDYKKLADTTKRNWNRWLDRIRDHFGNLRTAQFDRTDKIRPVIRRWRSTYADKPRNADYGMQVLSKLCSYAVDIGRLNSNPCEGIKHLYQGDRSDIIWLDQHITHLRATASKEIMWAVDLAALTGLRQGDLLLLSWSHIGEDSITIYTGKGRRQRRVAIIPLYAALRRLLASIPRRATTVLTSSYGMPWTSNGFQSSFNDAKIAAKMQEVDLHFHDLRGTAATKLYIANIPTRVIAEVLAWDEETVEKIIRRYVARGAATKALIAQIDGATRDARSSPEHSEGVYFIVSGNQVKIGWSVNVASRLQGLQVGSSRSLRLVHVVPGKRQDETRFHHEFEAHHIRGEWFRIEGSLATFLEPFLNVAENEAGNSAVKPL